MHYQLQRKEGRVEAQLEGLALLEGWQAMLPRLGLDTAAAGDDRLLLVLEGLVGFLGNPERRQVGQLAAQHLCHLERVAFLVPRQKLTGVTQQAAQERGLDLRVFASADEALAWLQG